MVNKKLIIPNDIPQCAAPLVNCRGYNEGAKKNQTATINGVSIYQFGSQLNQPKIINTTNKLEYVDK